jgi:hypothetical protein
VTAAARVVPDKGAWATNVALDPDADCFVRPPIADQLVNEAPDPGTNVQLTVAPTATVVGFDMYGEQLTAVVAGGAIE